MDQYYLFVILAPIAAMISISAAIYAWRRRLAPGALMLSLALFSITGWLVVNTMELISPAPEGTLLSAKFTYLFIVSAPVFWFSFALAYTGKNRWLVFPRYLIFWILPVITFTLVQINEMHLAIWPYWEAVPVNPHLHILDVTHGSWFWINIFYSYSLVLVGAIIIGIQHFRLAPIYQNQSRWVILGAVLPLIFNLIYVLRIMPNLKKDFSPLAFAFAGVTVAIGLFWHGLLDIMPIARNTILENMQEGLIVIDQKGRLLDINPAARKLLLPTNEMIIGKPLENYLPEVKHLLPNKNQFSRVREFSLKRRKTKRDFEGKLTGLYSYKNKRVGYLLVLEDITERKKLHEEVNRLATKDSLTNLHNRRHFLKLAQQELQRSYRYKHPVSLLILDIDHFKNINDTYGHLVGDEVIIAFANFLQKTLRVVDIIGRFGGDEFVAILPETNSTTALTTANRLCTIIRETPYETKKGGILFTLSIGISSEDDVKKDADLYALLERADRALYRAKSQGRNQVALEK